MKELITLSKTDPTFESYLLGSFSQSHRALPVKSLNLTTANEVVTFEVLPVTEITLPGFLKRWSHILKVRNWALVALPMVMVLMKVKMDQVSFDSYLAVLNCLGTFFLLSALNLRNDFQDHFWGLDRVHPATQLGPIQKGWISALSVRRLSRIFLVLGCLLGLPSLLIFPQSLIVILGFALLLMMTTGLHQLGMRYRWGTELASFLLPGPLLTLGFQISIGAGWDLEALWMGLFTGGLALFLLYLRNFELLMVNSQANFLNTVTRLGFERSQKLLIVVWSIWSLAFAVFHWVYAIGLWRWALPGILLLAAHRMQQNLKLAQSPAGSSLSQAVLNCRKLAWVVIAVWLVEQMSYLLVVEIGT